MWRADCFPGLRQTLGDGNLIEGRASYDMAPHPVEATHDKCNDWTAAHAHADGDLVNAIVLISAEVWSDLGKKVGEFIVNVFRAFRGGHYGTAETTH